jgi:hypothetical protein
MATASYSIPSLRVQRPYNGRFVNSKKAAPKDGPFP